MNNFDISKILSMLGKMDKKDLEEGLKKANEILKNKENSSKEQDGGEHYEWAEQYGRLIFKSKWYAKKR